MIPTVQENIFRGGIGTSKMSSIYIDGMVYYTITLNYFRH